MNGIRLNGVGRMGAALPAGVFRRFAGRKPDRDQARRMAMMLLGIVIMAFGVALFKLSLMGNDPATAMVIALGDRAGVDFSLILIGMNCLWFLAEWKWNKKLIGVGTFVNWFLVGPLASLLDQSIRSLWAVPDTMAARGLLMAGGVVILSLSCALYQTSDVGISPYDALSITLSEKTGLGYFWCRMATDAVCVAAAWALGGIVGLGTLICAVGMGPLVQFFSRHVARPLLHAGAKREADAVLCP